MPNLLGMIVTPLLVGLLAASAWMGAYAEPVHVQQRGTPERPGLILPALDREAFPDCVPIEKFDGIPSEVVVVTVTAEQIRMDFDKAWRKVEGGKRDLWTIGACA